MASVIVCFCCCNFQSLCEVYARVVSAVVCLCFVFVFVFLLVAVLGVIFVFFQTPGGAGIAQWLEHRIRD